MRTFVALFAACLLALPASAETDSGVNRPVPGITETAELPPPGVPGGGGPGPIVPGPNPFPQLQSRMFFDCPEGPGWMKLTLVAANGYKTYSQLFLGTRPACRQQAAFLRDRRSVIVKTVTVAVCSSTSSRRGEPTGPHHLHRWVVNEFGNATRLSAVYYKQLDECLADAAALMAD